MSIKLISTRNAPAAIGPYSQASVFDRLVFCSGQIGLNPETGELSESDTAGQMEQVMVNLGEVLKAAGSDWDRVLKCTIYLIDMKEFAAVNEVYGRYFSEEAPAREAVAVAALPKGARVEVSCIAHV
ncbi:RidA family protein [Balneolales bacterium ANBcel1]|nr:RidA family protein [Balneolales bacterium ANBcel1]